ncbi:ABC transporter substrate-binding protein [Streptomyces flavofungini]|uniref:ABC transporter substrate-binding protein n=1 Tax=Streptomyces flavofungini TaxID=68200 RepID=A0ABS0XJ18_9ACTN|nr:ABC transporter substrate-binding protein [Streptomyces flavofungini]MBJ3813197.1 ABC transporter substrate-binding protein [Streptomyces flavofungini]
MRRSRSVAAALASVVLAGLLTACGSGDGGSERSFTVALTEPDITSVPLMEAVDQVRAAGYDVTIEETAEPELAVEGLIRGDYQFSAEATGPALMAISRGAPVRIVADMVGNQWAVYGDARADDCGDLDGRAFGIFSEGAMATAMVRQWIEETCPKGARPQYLTIGDSETRAQALLAGEITATALEQSDVAHLAKSAKGRSLKRLADFRQVFPGLHPQTVYADADYLEQHPKPAQALIDALIDVQRKINQRPGHLAGLIREHLPDTYSEDTVEDIAAPYVEAKLFNAGALTPEGVQDTIDFFVDTGAIKPMDVADVADLSFVDRNRRKKGGTS